MNGLQEIPELAVVVTKPFCVSFWGEGLWLCYKRCPEPQNARVVVFIE